MVSHLSTSCHGVRLSSLAQTFRRTDVLADAKRFKESAGWYGDRGIPYRRGYLIHGTPGSGKTSLITAMAGELRLNICILNLSNPSLDVRSSNGLPQPPHHGRLTQTVAANRTGSSSS